MYVTLDEAKAHCNIYTDEFDALLTQFIEEAEVQVENYLNRTLASMTGEPPDPAALPKPVRRGICYYVADMWKERESYVIGTVVNAIPTADRLLFPYRIEMGV